MTQMIAAGLNPNGCFQVTTLGKLFTHMPLSPCSIGNGQGAVMPCSWEGNSRSGSMSETSVVYLSTGFQPKEKK